MSATLALLIVLLMAARWFWLVFKVQLPETPKRYTLIRGIGAVAGFISFFTTGFTAAAIV